MTGFPFRVVIPARYDSSRFPGKALALLAGRPILEHVWRQARDSGAAEVVVATDDARIAQVARAFGADVAMTASTHRSGTDRVAEVVAQRVWAAGELVVNCQGDAPLIPPSSLNQVADLLASNPGAAMATLCTPIREQGDYQSPHVVKVVATRDGRALYFSRAPIPAAGHGAPAAASRALFPASYRHVGLYAYRAGALQVIAASPPCDLEQSENLEQLRALWLGLEIRVGVVESGLGPDVDTPEDLARAAAYIARAGGPG